MTMGITCDYIIVVMEHAKYFFWVWLVRMPYNVTTKLVMLAALYRFQSSQIIATSRIIMPKTIIMSILE